MIIKSNDFKHTGTQNEHQCRRDLRSPEQVPPGRERERRSVRPGRGDRPQSGVFAQSSSRPARSEQRTPQREQEVEGEAEARPGGGRERLLGKYESYAFI